MIPILSQCSECPTRGWYTCEWSTAATSSNAILCLIRRVLGTYTPQHGDIFGLARWFIPCQIDAFCLAVSSPLFVIVCHLSIRPSLNQRAFYKCCILVLLWSAVEVEVHCSGCNSPHSSLITWQACEGNELFNLKLVLGLSLQEFNKFVLYLLIQIFLNNEDFL